MKIFNVKKIQTKQSLIYFPLDDSLVPYLLIKSARTFSSLRRMLRRRLYGVQNVQRSIKI